MLKFIKGSTATIICTLTEKQTIVDANYLFVFTDRATNGVVKFVLVNGSDISTNKDRWNEFSITVNTYFSTYSEGWYTYDVYEQASSSNTDLSLTGGLLETGLMWLDDNSDVTTTQYDNEVNFTMYDAG